MLFGLHRVSSIPAVMRGKHAARGDVLGAVPGEEARDAHSLFLFETVTLTRTYMTWR